MRRPNQLGVLREERRQFELGEGAPVGLVCLGELEPEKAAAGKLLDPELPQIFLEPAHHDRVELLLPAHGHTAREALRIEDLEERREAVGVPVVRRRAEEEPVLEARAMSRMTSVILESTA